MSCTRSLLLGRKAGWSRLRWERREYSHPGDVLPHPARKNKNAQRCYGRRALDDRGDDVVAAGGAQLRRGDFVRVEVEERKGGARVVTKVL